MKQQLKQIIKEELEAVMAEMHWSDPDFDEKMLATAPEAAKEAMSQFLNNETLENAQMAVDALKEAGVPPENEAMKYVLDYLTTYDYSKLY